MKFHVDALYSFKVMLRTKKGQTDGLTDGRVNYYMPPFGGIKKEVGKSWAKIVMRKIFVHTKIGTFMQTVYTQMCTK